MGGIQKLQNRSKANFEEPKSNHVPLGSKMKDVTLSGSNVSSTGLTTVIDVPAQGVTYTQRVADRCHFNRLDINLVIHNNATNVDDSFRFLVVQEIGQSTGPPLGTALLQANTTVSPLLYNAGKLFHILQDSLIPLSSNSINQIHTLRLQLRPVIKRIQFVTGTTTPYSGQIYLYMVSTKTTNTAFVDMHARLWFSDSD